MSRTDAEYIELGLEITKGDHRPPTFSSRDDDFLGSLITQAVIKKKELSEKQMFWLKKLVDKASSAVPSLDFDVEGIYKAIFEAREFIKFPKFTLPFGDGHTVRIKMSGARSKTPDIVQVDVDGTWIGSINPDGTYSFNCTPVPEMLEVIKELAGDFMETATKYGKETGSCVFCSQYLSDPRSVDNGYGKTCARNFGLEW